MSWSCFDSIWHPLESLWGLRGYGASRILGCRLSLDLDMSLCLLDFMRMLPQLPKVELPIFSDLLTNARHILIYFLPGWKVNAVEFDSIFNRSFHAFAWGGPDIVPMFQPLHRVGDERVQIESYPHDMLDFAAENITQIDDWVVNKFAVSCHPSFNSAW